MLHMHISKVTGWGPNMKKYIIMPILTALTIAATPASAAPGYTQVTSADEFIHLVAGKPLTRRGISFTIYANGAIQGSYNGRAMAGTWEWVGDAFCRTLSSPRQIFSCHKVTSNGEIARFMTYPRNGMSEVLEIVARNN